MDDTTPNPISPLVVGIMHQMTMDAHYSTQSLIEMLQPEADRYRILRDAMLTFAAGLDSKREEARLANLVYWVGELSPEAARSAIEAASYHDSNHYFIAKRQAGLWDEGWEA